MSSKSGLKAESWAVDRAIETTIYDAMLRITTEATRAATDWATWKDTTDGTWGITGHTLNGGLTNVLALIIKELPYKLK